MPPLPPTPLVLTTLSNDALPAAGGAAFAYVLFALAGRWATALGSAVAVVVAFAWANFQHDFKELNWEETFRLIPWKPDGDPPPAWHRLPRAAAVLVAVGLLSRWLGLLVFRLLTKPVENYFEPDAPPERVGRYWWGANLLTWAPRLAAVAVVSGWVVSEKVAAEWWWVRPALAAAVLLNWVALDGLARAGAGAQVAAYQWAVFLAAAAVLIHHHTGRFMETALVLGFAMLGVATAAGSAKGDASGAVPAGVGLLPGLMLAGRTTADSQVPLVSFWLVALAPLVLLPFLIPAVARLPRWVVIPLRALLILAPLVVAVALANQHEPLDFDTL